MAARPVNFLVGWSSGDTNTITVNGLFSVSKSGGGSQTITRNVVRGQVYNVGSSGSGPGSTGLRTYSNGQVGLDDRQGAGADGDYNDLTILPDRGAFYGASGGSCKYKWDAPPAPTVQLYLNGVTDDIAVSTGDTVNVVWETISNDEFAATGSITASPEVSSFGGPVTANQGQTFTTLPIGTTTFSYTGTNDGGSSTVSRSVTVYPLPKIDSFTISNSNPLQGQSVTVTWSTTDAVVVSLTANPGSAFPGVTIPSNVDASFSFVPTTGGSYSAKLRAENQVGAYVEQLIYWTVRDETPNTFGWDDKLDVSLLQRQNQESNTITINGFGPTQYPNSNLPIKSNYPVQIMVNGDGIWRDVEQI